jgi:biopolymer transport protein TolR
MALDAGAELTPWPSAAWNAARGQLFFGDEPLAQPQLAERVRAAATRDPALEVQLRADSAVPYGRVAELIGLVQAAGLTRIGFVTEVGPRPQ